MKQRSMLFRIGLFCIFLTTHLLVNAQLTQQVRGTVSELGIQKPLAGASVTLLPINWTVVSDEHGEFRFKNVPIGTYQLQVTFAGYREGFLQRVLVNAGKELVLPITLEPLVKVEEAVVVKASSRRNRPVNNMSLVSARAFTVEETQRYAASVNDPLRMATSFPGVLAPDDGNNSIIIRGNNPAGLLWRMEGLDIPNPNHFGYAATSGGGISILSAQLLANSDFLTAAFPASYGNALGGVFDLHLRKGNNEKREYTLQAGVLGLNAAAEGPLASFYGGSYLVNYRYSTLALLSKTGILSGSLDATDFQDLSYNIALPTARAGQFTLFGFAGRSMQSIEADLDSSKWENGYDRYPSSFVSNTSMFGVTHSILLGSGTRIHSAVGWSNAKNDYDEQYVKGDYSLEENFRAKYQTRKWMLISDLEQKLSSRLQAGGGVKWHLINYDFIENSRDHLGLPVEEVINSQGNTQTVQAYVQFRYRPVNSLAITGGWHFLELLYNRSHAVEPRLALQWNLKRGHSLSAAFGMHSQMQGLGLYFAREQQNGEWVYPNRDIDFTRARHWVLSYSFVPAKNWRVKAEWYYQQLYQAPVGTDTGKAFSVLNTQGEFITDALVNKGKGRNYGMELSLEKYLSGDYYFTASTSLYRSRYTALDGIERHTRFDGGYLVNVVAGRDFVYRQGKRTFGVNLKLIYAGGLRNTPVDLEASQQAGYAIYREKDAFSEQNPAYFRTDLRVSMKWNKRHLTSTLSLDLQNATNRLNVYNRDYDTQTGKIITNYQNGLIPVLNYKIEF